MRPGTLRLLPLLVLAVTLLAGGPEALSQTTPPPSLDSSGLPSPAALQVATAGPGGIAFLREGWIYYLPPGAAPPVRLRPGKFPALSPDGKKVAFCLERKAPDPEALKSTEPPGEAILEAVVFIGGFFGSGLQVLDLATGQEQTLLEPGELIRNPVWSPAGDRLALAVMKGKSVQVEVMQADGSGRRLLFPQGKEEKLDRIYGLSWVPDGKGLWFHDMRHLYQIDENGALLGKTPIDAIMGKQTDIFSLINSNDQFVPNPQEPQLLAFTKRVKAPQAFTKAFEDDFPEINAVFFYNTRTKARTRVTPKDMYASHPCWSRDGQYLYFAGFREPHYQEHKERNAFRLYRVGKDGKGLQEITRGWEPSL